MARKYQENMFYLIILCVFAAPQNEEEAGTNSDGQEPYLVSI
jgi:hypothetical protein